MLSGIRHKSLTLITPPNLGLRSRGLQENSQGSASCESGRELVVEGLSEMVHRRRETIFLSLEEVKKLQSFRGGEGELK